MKHYMQIDTETGEEIGSFVAVVRPRQKSLFQRHFTMNQNTLIKIATELTPEQVRVLLILLGDLDYENYILVDQAKIAESLSMLQPNVSRAIKGLLRNGVILEGVRIGRSKSYMLNPEYGWKGSVKNHKKILQAKAKKELTEKLRKANITEVIEGGLARETDPYTPDMLSHLDD